MPCSPCSLLDLPVPLRYLSSPGCLTVPGSLAPRGLPVPVPESIYPGPTQSRLVWHPVTKTWFFVWGRRIRANSAPTWLLWGCAESGRSVAALDSKWNIHSNVRVLAGIKMTLKQQPTCPDDTTRPRKTRKPMIDKEKGKPKSRTLRTEYGGWPVKVPEKRQRGCLGAFVSVLHPRPF